MIQVAINENGGINARHQDFSPSVYLDHCAILTISADQGLTARLAKTLESLGGTLALSWVNVAEFAKITDEQQARNAEKLIDAIIPRIFLLEVDPFRVIERENSLLQGGQPIPPHADNELLRILFEPSSESMALYSAHDLFNVARSPKVAQNNERLADTFVTCVETLRREDKPIPKTTNPIQRGTHYILRELMRPLIKDKQRVVTRNDAFDFYHAVVPVAYCDFVLLDKSWETHVDQARLSLNGAGVSVPIARVFSLKKGGLDRFFLELEQLAAG
jgi:hypothetical protein